MKLKKKLKTPLAFTDCQFNSSNSDAHCKAVKELAIAIQEVAKALKTGPCFVVYNEQDK